MNSKNSILLLDPDFDPNAVSRCVLLIRVTADSFSYAIIDKASNQLKAVYDQQECISPANDLAQRIKHDSYLSLPFQSIKVSLCTENSIAVPNDLFDAAKIHDYTQYFSEPQSARLYVQPSSNFGFTTIFSLTEFLEETLGSLANGKRYDHSAPLLSLASGKKSTALLLDFTVGCVHATYLDGGQLVFQKYYQTDNPEEFNYYLLLIINQLKINTGGTEVYLSGIIHHDDSKYNCISKYFKSIQFSPAGHDEMDSRILDDMPAHYYSSLLALDQCV
jgi:hypothetical protein